MSLDWYGQDKLIAHYTDRIDDYYYVLDLATGEILSNFKLVQTELTPNLHNEILIGFELVQNPTGRNLVVVDANGIILQRIFVDSVSSNTTRWDRAGEIFAFSGKESAQIWKIKLP